MFRHHAADTSEVAGLFWYSFGHKRSTHNGYMPLKRVKRRRVARSERRVAKGATPHRLRRSSPSRGAFHSATIKNNLLYSFRDYGILALYVLAKVH